MKSENFICVERYYLFSKHLQPRIEYYRVYGKNKKHFDNLMNMERPKTKDESSEDEDY